MYKAKLIQEATSKELKEKLEEKAAKLEEVEQRCKKLEMQNAETINELRTLILEKKTLVEQQLKKKKKRFCLFRRRDAAASSPDASSFSTSVPSKKTKKTTPKRQALASATKRPGDGIDLTNEPNLSSDEGSAQSI